jgi:hypothetical protein
MPTYSDVIGAQTKKQDRVGQKAPLNEGPIARLPTHCPELIFGQHPTCSVLYYTVQINNELARPAEQVALPGAVRAREL